MLLSLKTYKAGRLRDNGIAFSSAHHQACIAARDLRPGVWRALSTSAEMSRFSEIMELMDDRYHNSGLALAGWLESKAASGQHPELFGWSPNDSPQELLQVMGITGRRNEVGDRVELTIRRLGVAADRLAPSECDEAAVEHWLARYLLFLMDLGGAGCELRAMRPKTMTWKPMERMHDLMREGLVLETGPRGESRRYLARVVEERDRGAALFWHVRFETISGS